MPFAGSPHQNAGNNATGGLNHEYYTNLNGLTAMVITQLARFVHRTLGPTA